MAESYSGYILSLSGLDWHLIAADAEGRNIVSQMAAIMGLSPALASNNKPKLLFTSAVPDSASFSVLASAGSSEMKREQGADWQALQFPFLQVWRQNQSADVICQVSAQREYLMEVMAMMMAIYPIVTAALQAGGLHLHAGLVAKGGKGVLLAGPGGTGKSTCCARIEPPWQTLCDDESMVLPGNRAWQAAPFPTWSELICSPSAGTQWQVQAKTDLAALCFLEQAESDMLLPLGKGEAAARISDASLQILARYLVYLGDQARSLRATVFANAVAMADTIPAYRLQVARHGQFWGKLDAICGAEEYG